MSADISYTTSYQADLQTLTEALVHTGCGERINPESLTAFQEHVEEYGYSGSHPTKENMEVRLAYNRVMDGFRALFAPVRSN